MDDVPKLATETTETNMSTSPPIPKVEPGRDTTYTDPLVGTNWSTAFADIDVGVVVAVLCDRFAAGDLLVVTRGPTRCGKALLN